MPSRVHSGSFSHSPGQVLGSKISSGPGRCGGGERNINKKDGYLLMYVPTY